MSDLYNRFFGFRKSPFNITPDPRMVFFSERHRDALDHMLFGITQRKGFIQLTGEVGCGKTTLCRAVLERLPKRYETALILNPCMTEIQLLRAILDELGLNVPASCDRVAYLDALNRFLLDCASDDRDVVLVIDEAQDMSNDLLEQVRLLSNLETDDRKLMQIVLIGQPELRDKLNNPALRQLRQRITVRFHIDPLSRVEIHQYIRHRIAAAGGAGYPTFTDWALRKIYRYSGGVPRLVNAVCDKALLCAYVGNSVKIDSRTVARAIHELEGRVAA